MITYESHTSELTVADLEGAYGTNLTFHYKDGFLREEVDSKYNQLTIWRHDRNRIYTQDHSKSDTLFSESAFVPEMMGYDYEIYSNADTILERVCQRLRYMSRGREKNYYFSEFTKIDPMLFGRYTKSHRREIMNLMGSIPLRIELLFPDFSVNYKAIEVEEKKLKDGLFEIPKSKVEVKL